MKGLKKGKLYKLNIIFGELHREVLHLSKIRTDDTLGGLVDIKPTEVFMCINNKFVLNPGANEYIGSALLVNASLVFVTKEDCNNYFEEITE